MRFGEEVLEVGSRGPHEGDMLASSNVVVPLVYKVIARFVMELPLGVELRKDEVPFGTSVGTKA